MRSHHPLRRRRWHWHRRTECAVPDGPARVQVQEREFNLVLSRTSIQRGPAIVEVVNAGEDSHDLMLQREDSGDQPLAIPELRPGEISDTRLDLAPGTWRLWCSLPGHAELGMHAQLTVD